MVLSLRRTTVCIALSLATSAVVFAQGPRLEPDVPEKAGKDLHAFHIVGAPPRIDGEADDEVWRLAASIDDMVQNEPDNMMAPSERTVIQVAYDDKNVYVLARCMMRDPSQIVTGLGRRDAIPPSDLIRITFDPRHDHLTAYTFDTNPSGIQSDYTWYDDTRQNSDYDAVWSVRSVVTAEGWNAEYQIPFSQMRFTVPSTGPMVWGFNIRRDIYRRGEFDRWVGTPRGAQGFVSRMGHLIFDDAAAPPRRLEFVPYATAGVEVTTGRSADPTTSAGFDLRRGLGTSATLSATVNPDFAQVELDPAVLNLSVFETFFPEKRPFFLEDSRTFVLNYGQFPLFHSRRIGQAPGRLPLAPGDTLISKPDQTTIIGAAKLTGKANGWTFGGLTALTNREYATVERTDLDVNGNPVVSRTERLIEPYTSYSVGRVQRDIRRSSNVGMIGTAVVREKTTDAFTGGFDYNMRWHRNLYQWDGHWVATQAAFGTDMRTGGGGVTRFNYLGKFFAPYANVDHFSKDFKNTDLGFLSGRNNKSRVTGGFNLNQPDPWKHLRSSGLFMETARQWTGDGVTFDKYVGAGAYMQFRNFWQINFNSFHNFRRLDDLDTRGGPPIVRPASQSVNVGVNSDSRKRWRLSAFGGASWDAEGGWNANGGPSFSFQPSPRLQTSVSANYTHAQDIAQWITNTDTDGDGATDNVYGHLERDVLSLTGRTAYSFDRNITLEVYLQPFVAVGAYSDIKRLALPSSFVFAPAAISYNPDFNNKSLRGNVVLRWEYHPGSTLFAVWNMSTSDASRPGDFSPLRDLGAGFGAAGTHVFMIKLNYWLGL